MCMGGKPKPPPPPPPPPQLAKMPDAPEIRKNLGDQLAGQSLPATTLLTSGQGDPLQPDKLSKKTLLGS